MTFDAFARAKLGPITLRNRVIKAVTFEGRRPKRVVTPELIEFHRRFAAGEVGMTTVAYYAVTRAGATDGRQILLHDLPVGAGLRALDDVVHAAGAAVANTTAQPESLERRTRHCGRWAERRGLIPPPSPPGPTMRQCNSPVRGAR